MKTFFLGKFLLGGALISGFSACAMVNEAQINKGNINSASSNKNVSMPIPEAGEVEAFRKQIVAIGCRIFEQTDMSAESMSPEETVKWQTEQFNLRSKISFIAKCRTRDRLFYKFLFQQEIYETEADAAKRLPRIHELPPNENDKSDFAVPIILREGFRIGNKIYTVGTFTAKVEIEGDVKRRRQQLEKAVR